MRDELEKVREWAQEKLRGESEPPWAWYRYMQLLDCVTAIVEGMDAVSPTGHSQQSARRSGAPLRLVADTDQPDTAQPRPDEPKPRLPM